MHQPGFSILRPAVGGAWIMEAILMGVWSALGPGPIATRIPMTVICLGLAVAQLVYLDSRMGPIERYEFTAILAIGFSFYLITLLALGLIRRMNGLHLSNELQVQTPPTHFQFRISYLLALTTVLGIALAVTQNVRFDDPQPQSTPNVVVFGPSFVVAVMVYASVFCFVAELPIVPMALFALRPIQSKKTSRILFSVWGVVTFGLVLLLNAMEDSWRWDFVAVILVQAGGASCALLSAMLLRSVGIRLRKGKEIDTATSFPTANSNGTAV